MRSTIGYPLLTEVLSYLIKHSPGLTPHPLRIYKTLLQKYINCSNQTIKCYLTFYYH